VHCENLLIDNGGDRQAVEAVGERLPQLDVVPSLALIVETVDTVDAGTLVVATENEEILGVLDLVRKEQANRLERLLASVYVVAEEEVVGLWWEAAVLEEAQEVVVLAVNVTADLDFGQSRAQAEAHVVKTNLDGRLKLQKNRLRDEDLASLSAQESNLSL